MTTRSPAVVTLLAMLLAEAVLAMGDIPPAPAAPALAGAAGQGFTCALVARSEGRSTLIEGRVEAEERIEADYDLRIRGPGVSVNQSGEQTVVPGGSVVLGEAQVTGRLSDLEASLAVTVGGRTADCPLRSQ